MRRGDGFLLRVNARLGYDRKGKRVRHSTESVSRIVFSLSFSILLTRNLNLMKFSILGTDKSLNIRYILVRKVFRIFFPPLFRLVCTAILNLVAFFAILRLFFVLVQKSIYSSSCSGNKQRENSFRFFKSN